MRATVLMLPVLLPALMVAAGCSQESGPSKEGVPRALEVCKFAGEIECGLEADGKGEAVLLCEVTQEYGRVWMVVASCAVGCEGGECLPELVPDVGSGGDGGPEVAVELPPVCVPECAGKVCGPDGCGGACGLCPADHKCSEAGSCFLHCEPQCLGKQCGDDGCGGSCGDCPFQMSCEAGLCACTPHCEGKDCGPDGCGGDCGACAKGYQCSPFGVCVGLCQPACADKQCGPDGCGGICGVCGGGLYCSPEGQCTNTCYPSCAGKQCGSDGCFGVCGWCPCETCANDQTECNAQGQCVASQAGIGCYDLILCLNECVDSACQTACFNSATPTAQNLYDELIDCIIVQCGYTPSDACVQESLTGLCSGQYMACVND